MERKSGSIVNVASIYGMVGPDFSLYEGTPIHNSVSYAYAKGGMINLTRYLASFLAPHGVRVNTLSPGGVFAGQPEQFVANYNKRVPDGTAGRMARTFRERPFPGVRCFSLHYGPEYCRGWRLDRDMKSFSALDYTAVVLYLLAIAAFGSSFYRRNSTAREYFLGNRFMSWLPAGISIIAADLSAISVMGAPAWAYKNNLEMLWVAVGYPLVAPLVVLVFVPFYSSLNLYTAYDIWSGDSVWACGCFRADSFSYCAAGMWRLHSMDRHWSSTWLPEWRCGSACWSWECSPLSTQRWAALRRLSGLM